MKKPKNVSIENKLFIYFLDPKIQKKGSINALGIEFYPNMNVSIYVDITLANLVNRFIYIS